MEEVRRLAKGMRRVLESIDTALDPRDVLYGLVEVAVEVVECDRAAVLAVDGDHLLPRAVWGRRANQQLFRRFRRMAPVALDDARRAVLEGDGVVVIDDPSEGDLVPKPWRDAFHTSSLALVPVRSAGAFHGLLAVDYITPHAFTPAELELVRALAELARVAMQSAVNAALATRQRARSVALHRAFLRIASGEDSTAIAELTAEAVADVLPGVTAIVLDAGTRRPPESDVVDVALTLPGGPHDRRLWLRSRAPLDGDDLVAAEAIAAQAAFALRAAGAHRIAEDRAKDLEAIARLPDLLRHDPIAIALGRDVTGLFGLHGIEWCDLAFRDARIADLTSSRTLLDREVAFLNRLVVERRSIGQVDASGLTGVLIEHAGRPAGLLLARLATPAGPQEVRILGAVAKAIENAIARRGLQRAVSDLERRVAVNAKRLSIAEQLDDAASRVLTSLWTALNGEARVTPSTEPPASLARLRALVVEAGVLTHILSAAFAAQRVHDVGLVQALRDLAGDFERTSTGGAVVALRDHPSLDGLDTDRRIAVFAVVYEALALQASARSSVVVVSIGDEPLRVSVRDDGIPLSQRVDAMRSPAAAMSTIRQHVAPFGGSVTFHAAVPRGLVLEVTFGGAVLAEARPSAATPSV